MPLVIPLTFYLLLPQPEAFASVPIPSSYEDEEEPAAEYTTLPTSEDETEIPKSSIELSFEDKWHLVKPLLRKYMLPLCKCMDPFSLLTTNAASVVVLVYTVSAAID